MLLAILLAITVNIPAAQIKSAATEKIVSPQPSSYLTDSLSLLLNSDASKTWKPGPSRVAFARCTKIADKAVKSKKLSTRKGTRNECSGDWSQVHLYANGVEGEETDHSVNALVFRDSSLRLLGLAPAESMSAVTRKFGTATATAANGELSYYRSTQPGVKSDEEETAGVWNLYFVFQNGRLVKAVLCYFMDDC